MSLGEKIQKLRKARGISQEELADHLNVSRQAISKWETDQSLPDIEKILAISKLFSISTDELLENEMAGSPGDSVHPLKKTWADDVHWFRGLRDRKINFMIFTLLCFLAIGICMIVNYAIDKQITWAAYPMISVPLGWSVITPLLFKKYTVALCVLTVTVSPFLYFLDQITPVPSWFCRLGLPSAIIGVVFLWVIYLLFRFIRISPWYKVAISFLLAGVMVNPMISYLADQFSGTKPSVFNFIINTFSYLTVSAIFWILGYTRNKAKASQAVLPETQK